MNKFNHIVIEAYCRSEIKRDCPVPNYCDHEGVPTYMCLFRQCPLFDFTSYEYALLYSGKDSDAETDIALGDDADLELWEEICRRKIDEAWEEYIKVHPEEADPWADNLNLSQNDMDDDTPLAAEPNTNDALHKRG